jgi:hypothetical protein
MFFVQVADGQSATETPHLVHAGALKWEPSFMGCEHANVSGDPNAEGKPFVLRIRCPDGTMHKLCHVHTSILLSERAPINIRSGSLGARRPCHYARIVLPRDSIRLRAPSTAVGRRAEILVAMLQGNARKSEAFRVSF